MFDIKCSARQCWVICCSQARRGNNTAGVARSTKLMIKQIVTNCRRDATPCNRTADAASPSPRIKNPTGMRASRLRVLR